MNPEQFDIVVSTPLYSLVRTVGIKNNKQVILDTRMVLLTGQLN